MSIQTIDGLKDGVYIIQDGEITTLEPKQYGQDTIIWRNGQVQDIELAERVRIKKGK